MNRGLSAARLPWFLRRQNEYYKCAVSLVGSQYEVVLTTTSSAPQRICFASEAEAEQYWASRERQLRDQGWWAESDSNL